MNFIPLEFIPFLYAYNSFIFTFVFASKSDNCILSVNIPFLPNHGFFDGS